MSKKNNQLQKEQLSQKQWIDKAQKAKHDLKQHHSSQTKKPWYKRWTFWIVALLILGIIGALNEEDNFAVENEKQKNPPVQIDNENNEKYEKQTNEKEEIATKREDIVEDDVPLEYRSALKVAERYSNTLYMSKQGIYDQLVSDYGEKFPEEAAQYAIEHLDADWNENAVKKGQNYAETMHMSKQGVYDQLISDYGEKFTPEEAQYAVEQLDVDWNENALKKAHSYVETMSMSKQGVYDQLISDYGEKFTPEEAQYAIDHLE